MSEKVKNILITIFVSLSAAALIGGCALVAAPVGVAGAVSSPSASEKEVPAEFNLRATKGKIAVIVNQPSWIKSPMDLRITLTDYINRALEEKVELKKERLIPYTEVQKSRLSLPTDKKDDPFEINSKLGAKYVLAVQVADFDLSSFAEEDFYNGTITTKSCLFDANGTKLWPTDANNTKTISLAFETEKGTVKSSIERLCGASAYCITRYFYNCKKENFRVPEEQKEYENYTW